MMKFIPYDPFDIEAKQWLDDLPRTKRNKKAYVRSNNWTKIHLRKEEDAIAFKLKFPVKAYV